MKAKIIGNYPFDKVVTPLIFLFMRDKKEIMFFPSTEQIMLDEEVDKWNRNFAIIHGERERITFHFSKWYHNGAYVITTSNSKEQITIPFNYLSKDYNEFIDDVESEIVLYYSDEDEGE